MAIRAEVYEEFSGTVKGSVKEKSGIEYLFELCEANQYSTNLELAPGDYHLSVDAVEKERLYRVLYDEAKFSMQEAEVKIENLQVTGECIGMATDTEDMRSSANAPQTEKNGNRWSFRRAVKDYRKTYYSCSDYFPWGISVCAEEKATIYIGGRKCQNEKK